MFDYRIFFLLCFYTCLLYTFEKKGQKNCVKFCVKNEIKCARTFEMLTAEFNESTMSRIQVKLWYNRCKECQKYVNDATLPGRRCMSTTHENIEAVRKMILDNRYTLYVHT